VRASPIRSASVNLAPAVPYHTSIRVSLSTPIVALKKRTRIHYQTDEKNVGGEIDEDVSVMML
jgi:hypothetical protein